MRVIGQQDNINIIDKWEDLPRFLIIQGEKDSGKNYIIKYLCDKFGIKYEYKSNAVSAVRELAGLEYIREKTLYHFEDFDTASIQAKNALLKIAEEPIDNMYIVLTGRKQLDTLESRAKKLLMTPYTETDIIEFVQQLDIDKDKFTDEVCIDLYRAGLNTPTKFKFYSQYDKIGELLKFAEDVVSRIICIDIDELVYIVGSFESKYDDLDVCNLFLIFIINLIEYKIKTEHYYSYYEILKLVIAYQEMLVKEPSLNRRMLLYQLFYSILDKSINQMKR